MGRKPTTKESIKNKTTQKMKKLGVFKPEYDDAIDIYSDLCEQYYKLTKRLNISNLQYSVETSDGGEKKSPLVSTLEALRKDILQYSDRLCLNPQAAKKESKGDKKKISALAEALAQFE